MPRKAPDVIGKKRMNTLTAAYHPDSVKHMLEKHGPGITDEQAKQADQEWASTRSQQFARKINRGDSQSIEALMQEPPLNAGIPMQRSAQFDYIEANVGLGGMTVAESQSDGPAAKPSRRAS